LKSDSTVLTSDSTLRHIRCPDCRALQQIGCWCVGGGRMIRGRYSDGVVLVEPNRIITDNPLVFRCHRCGTLNRVDEAIDLERQDRFYLRLWNIIVEAGPVVEQSADVCDAALRSTLLRGGEIRTVRDALLHRSNDAYRLLPDDQKLPPERRSAAWGENLRALVEECDLTKPRDVACAAEVLRELGRFNEASTMFQRHWHFEESETIWYGIEAIDRLSYARNPYVQLTTKV
jgi:hypothetical protein